MARFRLAEITEIIAGAHDCAEVKVTDGSTTDTAIGFPPYHKVQVGDKVVINTTAVDLGLGTGGVHFIHCNVTDPEASWSAQGHIMKMRYTSWQQNVLAAEEEDSPLHEKLKDADDIEGMPVISLPLHSHIAPAAALIKYMKPELRVGLLHTDAAALPIAFSKTVKELSKKRLIEKTVTAGNSWGGDYEAINIFSGLLIARKGVEADICLCSMGPGMVGTSTKMGFGGMEQAVVLNAAHSLGGKAILTPRISFADQRSRHKGMSRQTLAVMERGLLVPYMLAIPVSFNLAENAAIKDAISSIRGNTRMVKEYQAQMTKEALDHFGLKTFSMGRQYEEDPLFFQSAGASALAGLELIS